MKEKSGSAIRKAIVSAVFLAAAAVVGFFGMFMVMGFIPSVKVGYILGALYLLGILAVLISIWSKNLLQKLKRPLQALALLGVVCCAGAGGYDYYISKIPTVRDAVNMSVYYPYRGESVARLEEESTLKLTSDLPVLDCATALYPVAAAFVEAAFSEAAYTGEGEGGEGPLRYSGTSWAYEELIRGNVDIILVAGPSEDQLAYAEEQGVELCFTPVGKEAFVFFVSSRNPVEDLSFGQIQGIYSGEITNWKELGGKNTEIRAFQRNVNSGSQTALIGIMGEKELMTPPTEDVMDVMSGIVNRVADYRNFSNAIGFSFRFYATEMMQSDTIKLLKINGVYPDKDTIRSGEYPMSSYFYAVTADTENPNVERFLAWILSEQGQALIEKTGYVGVG